MGYVEDNIVNSEYLDNRPGLFKRASLRKQLKKDALKVYRDLISIDDLEFLSDEALFNSSIMEIRCYDYNYTNYDLSPIDEALVENELFNTSLLKRSQHIESVNFLFTRKIGTDLLRPNEIDKVTKIMNRFRDNQYKFESISYGKHITAPLRYFEDSKRKTRRCLERYLDSISD